MDDLADLGSAFNSDPGGEDEVSRKLAEWEKEGFSVDRIKEILSESDREPKSELDRFEAEVLRMRALRERLEALDRTGIEDSVQKVRIKLPYTYMATDVEHDIAELESLQRSRSQRTVPEEEAKLPETPPPDTNVTVAPIEQKPLPPVSPPPSEPVKAVTATPPPPERQPSPVPPQPRRARGGSPTSPRSRSSRRRKTPTGTATSIRPFRSSRRSCSPTQRTRRPGS
jgi:DNA-binding transcriptional MerR regulator